MTGDEGASVETGQDQGQGSAADDIAVLLVEDNPGDATLVEHYVRQGSMYDVADEVSVTHVEDLATGIDRLEDEPFDLVLLDLGLPESTGLATLERLPEEMEVPVVVLTGLDDHETAVQAIQRGAQDYLPKDDLDTDRLMRSLRYAVERHKQAAELRRRNAQLELFNSVLRHDVQNGMDVINKRAQILTETAGEDAREHADAIVEWSEDMISLTRDVQAMLSALSGEVETEHVNLSETVADQVDQVRAREGVTVDADVPGEVLVEADEMLSAVLGNVLTNAVEHNDREEPTVEVTVTKDADAGVARVRVADDGPGVPDDLKEAVFGRGVQADPDGGGFGLYFVATMADAYDGSVTVADNDPRGTVVELSLPLAAAWDRPA